VNADCRVQSPRGSVGGGWGVPTWPLTLETLWCQKSDAGRGGNPDRRLNREAARMLQRPRGQDSPRAPWVQVLFLFGASDSPGLFGFISPGTSCAASITRVLQPPHGDQLAGDVSCGDGRMRNRALAAQPLKWGGSSRFARPEPTGAAPTSSTPSVSCGGFIPGLSARVVVWFIGVEVYSSDRFRFARRFTPVSGHYFGRECVYAGRRAILSVVVPADVAAATLGVRVATTDCAGIAHRDAGALLFGVVHTGQRSLGLCWRDRQGRSVTRLPAILKNKTEVGQVWTGAPTVGPGNRGADAIESLSANQGSRSERNASDVSDAYWVRTGRNADEKHDLFLCRGVV